MRSQFAFQCMILFLAVGVVQPFGWIGIVLGAVEGVASGVFKGTIGAFSPLAKEGLGSVLDFFGGLMGGAGQSAGSVANQGMGALGSIANQGTDMMSSMFGGLGGILQQIMGSWGSIFSQLMSGGGDLFGSLFNIISSFFNTFFSKFGSLSFGSRLEINKMALNTGNVFASTMKLKLNPEKNHASLKKELLAAQKVMETKHAHKDAMVKALKTHAPQLTSAVHSAYISASKEMQKHMKTLKPETKKGVTEMRAIINKAGFDFGSVLSLIPTLMNGMGGMADIFGKGLSLITNLFSAFKMVIPV